ncbi:MULTISPECIES: aldehyde dehydrogenase family protein [Pseudonocardia]|uniref:Sulfoacetaldehyde dehydrogenase n=2 Tax=Pseudonocardia TaxID=1847 RepID=A0A1Y2MT98_PSEAH|nr:MULTISPECIES: aldehyde dehydrogenase family protein [Pseudonocardia]OSY37748.1 Sulfoacetaldehyde dehydrogenase [Pseudonocardia autotrophica]TDN75762.1 acyl-CoA reductase-like NAD-dependent aldehyde dehydrogenase [Pseudonocardia autotrophica]BBF99732.1 aldehyde dehydrogenase [Pseudonocardia autotrophica]GEC27177.1 aldehyde dehydrogenase [Pseudonocardia saturnea]
MTFVLPELPPGLPIGAGHRTDTGSAPVVFPYDGSEVAGAPVGRIEHATAALDAGAAAVRPAARLAAGTRRAVLLDVHRELAGHRDAFVELLIAETGRTRADCTVEVDRTLFTWEAAAEEIGHLHGETVPLDLQPSGEGLVGFWVRKPIGLVVGIAGFNAPFLLASHKIAPALAAGCPVICKPAPATPLATLWLADVVRRALVAHGAPAELVQVVTGDAEVGRTLVTDPRVAAVSFTGSAAVGHAIARAAAPRKTLLELGSNTALVVAADADLDRAADAVLRGGFYFNGQACIAVQRVLVCEPVREEFVARLTARMGELTVGDPREPSTRVAPLIDAAATERVLSWIDRARQAGATVPHGGRVIDRTVEPTLLLDVPESADAWCEEIFGPVVAIRSVPDLPAAFEAVNRSRYGLHAAVFTRSLATAFTALDELEVGGVVVNEVPGFRSDVMPYGGVKDSGIGREGPRFAIEELTVTRMAVIRPE